jgi:protein-L-isoaspartate(D-aspartate) O-methyltransferase
MTPAVALAKRLRKSIADERVLAAIASIPRELFVPAEERRRAYANVALPILAVLDLQPSDRVLDVGTGSGYHAALLALLAGEVWTIERHPELSARAADAIDELGLDNVSFIVGDGLDGFPPEAPFDAINVAAAASDGVPEVLEQQLAVGGRLVIPVGADVQRLILSRRTDRGFERTELEGVRFVPLVRD